MPAPPAIQANRLTPWDYTGMATGFLLTLLITLVNSRHRLLWEDEMLGWLLLHDPSFPHMLRAWNLGADGGGFSFYLLGRAWFALFGSSPLAFRLFSSTCFGLAFVTLWAALRRAYPPAITAFAAANTLFFSPPFTLHMVEGRFYGLLVLATSLAFYLTLRLDAAPPRTPKHLLLAAFLTHALLTTSHLLGVVYSATLLLATLLLDLLIHRRPARPGLYFTIASTWLLLLPEHTAIAAAARAGKPHFWTIAPTAATLLGAYTGFSHEILIVLALLLLAAFVVRARTPHTFRQAFAQRPALYIATLALLLVPIAFLFEGPLTGTWLFNERYLLPVTLALAPLTAELLFLLTPTLRRLTPPTLRRPALASLAILFLAFLLLWDLRHVRDLTESSLDYSLALSHQITAANPDQLPIVCEDAFTFAELVAGSTPRARYTYLLDWPYAISPTAPRLEAMQFHLMQNWRNAGYFPTSIQDAPTFLATHPRFLILHAGPATTIGNPLAARLTQNPHYTIKKLLTYTHPHSRFPHATLYLATRTTNHEPLSTKHYPRRRYRTANSYPAFAGYSSATSRSRSASAPGASSG